MSFKPVKSKRTSKNTTNKHSYENTSLSRSYEKPPHPPSSPLPPSAPPSTPLQKTQSVVASVHDRRHKTETNDNGDDDHYNKQQYKQQKHHHSSPSLAAALSLPPPPQTSSSNSNLPADTNNTTVTAKKDDQSQTSSSFSFSGYHINRLSSAISKNTPQLFKSFSTIATTNNSSSGRSLSKAFSISTGNNPTTVTTSVGDLKPAGTETSTSHTSVNETSTTTGKIDKILLNNNNNSTPPASPPIPRRHNSVDNNLSGCSGDEEFDECQYRMNREVTESSYSKDDYQDEATVRPRDLALSSSSASMVSHHAPHKSFILALHVFLIC